MRKPRGRKAPIAVGRVEGTSARVPLPTYRQRREGPPRRSGDRGVRGLTSYAPPGPPIRICSVVRITAVPEPVESAKRIAAARQPSNGS